MPNSVTCTRRAVLIGTLAVGAVAVTSTWHAVAESPIDCRQWCLRFADNACRAGQRPACASLDDS